MSNAANKKLVVIGAGPGGYAAAFRAADLGIDVTLIDTQKNPGGVCLYKGCIPSKALLHAAKIIQEAEHIAEAGITFGKPKIDVKKLAAWKSSVVEKMTSGLGQLSKARKINFVQGRASFSNSSTVMIKKADGLEETMSFDYALVATGSEPNIIPNLPKDSPHFWDSTKALELNEIPKTLLVVGGGYIGLELGSVYAALGTKVTVVELGDSLLTGADRDLVKILAKNLETKLHKILLSTKVTEYKEVRGGVQVTFDSLTGKDATQVFEKVLVCVGRKPLSQGLGLENTKIKINERGFITVDQQLRTTESHIFAVGDIIGNPMLAHKATHEGLVAAEVIAGHRVFFDAKVIPAVVFTDPEIAWCGLTETEAKQQGKEIKIAQFPWQASGRATSMGLKEGLTKLIIDPQSEKILGVGIAGSGAGELIAEGALAIEMGATALDLALTIHSHPTLSETIMEAADVFFGQSVHVYKPKKR